MGVGGGKKAHLPKIFRIHPTMMKLVQLCYTERRSKKIYKSREAPLEVS